MGRKYQPINPFDVPLKILNPTTTKVKGVTQKVYPDPEDVDTVIFGSIRTYGGTESMSNDIYTVFDTATLDTWYNPSITAESRIYFCETQEIWNVAGRPENIGMRHQYMQVKLEKVGGMP